MKNDDDRILEDLRRRLPATLERMYAAADNGIASPSSGGGSTKGSHRDLSDRLDDNGNRRPDAAREALAQLLFTMRRINTPGANRAHHVTALKRIIDRWDPNGNVKAHMAGLTVGPPGCRSCQRVGTWSPINAHGMCKTCERLLARVLGQYEFAGDMPPLILVDLSRAGARITSRVIDSVMVGHKPAELG